jgi:cytochrome d ubiquinol oxidase subunit I
VLPTFLSVSSVPAADVWISIGGFALFYSVLAVVEVYLMVRTIRHGPLPPPAAAAPGALRPA